MSVSDSKVFVKSVKNVGYVEDAAKMLHDLFVLPLSGKLRVGLSKHARKSEAFEILAVVIDLCVNVYCTGIRLSILHNKLGFPFSKKACWLCTVRASGLACQLVFQISLAENY